MNDSSFVKSVLFLFLAMPVMVFADANSCDDYLSRHYKKDLVAERAFFYSRTHMGEIRYPHQVVKLKIKNVGEMDMNVRSSDVNGYRPIWIKVKGRVIKTQFKVPLDSGQSTTVYLTLRRNTLRHCGKVEFVLDTKHNVGQWGCQVWNNDRKLLKTRIGGRLCRN